MRPLNSCVVVVTPRSFDDEQRSHLAEQLGEVRYHPGPLRAEELAEAVADADGLIAGLDDVSEEVFARASRLRVVARYGVGLDSVDLRAAAEHGVTITVTPGANANAVAELAVAFLFVLARPVIGAIDRVRQGEWPALRGVELQGRTLGLIGVGRIGSLVALKAAALGLRVVAYDPNVADSSAELVDLPTLAEASDFVSLHLPLTHETRGMVDRSFLAQLKPGALLINTARGELIDEGALLWALDEGPLAGAALDVLVDEPAPVDHPFRTRRDVLLTPHLGSATTEATAAMSQIAADEVLAVLSGRRPRFAV